MHLFPYRQETIVLPYSAEEALFRLRRYTRPIEKGVAYSAADEQQFLFNGVVNQQRFRISRKLLRPENFLSLMVGWVEGTSVGSLLFVRYQLFFATALFLIFWSVVCLLLCLFFLIYHEAWWYAAISFGVGLVQYVVAVKNFHWQAARSRKELEKALFGHLSTRK